MTGKNRTPYLRLTVADVQYLIEILEGADLCCCDHGCDSRQFSKLMVRMDDFLIREEREGKKHEVFHVE